MKKYFVASILQKKINLRVYADDSKCLEEKEYALLTVANAVISIKSFTARHPGPKEFYLVIDEEANYHRVKTEGAKTKEELRSLWDINSADYFGYVEKPTSANKRLYFGLSYKAAQIDPYLNMVRKTGLSCAGIIPLDFLYLKNLLPGIFATRENKQLLIRIFDRAGNFIYKKVYLASAAVPVVEEVDKVLTYIVREKIADIENSKVETDYPVNDALNNFPQKIQLTASVYTENRKDLSSRRKARLSTSQKAIIFFISVIVFLMIIPFLQQFHQAFKIKQDIIVYQKNLSAISPLVNQLSAIEQKTKYLKSRKSANSYALKLILERVETDKMVLVEIAYDISSKLLSCVFLGNDEQRNKLLVDLKAYDFVEAVNLIYIKPKNKLNEFKVIVKIR